MDTKYNGWTNYSTWRVSLELFDGFDPTAAWPERVEVAELADNLQAMAEDALTADGATGLALDYALAFMADVNWREIAAHMLADYYQEADA